MTFQITDGKRMRRLLYLYQARVNCLARLPQVLKSLIMLHSTTGLAYMMDRHDST
jgi:hypothetical protein